MKRLVWVVKAGRFYDTGPRGVGERPGCAKTYPPWAVLAAFLRSLAVSRDLLCYREGRGLANKWVYRPRLEWR